MTEQDPGRVTGENDDNAVDRAALDPTSLRKVVDTQVEVEQRPSVEEYYAPFMHGGEYAVMD